MPKKRKPYLHIKNKFSDQKRVVKILGTHCANWEKKPSFMYNHSVRHAFFANGDEYNSCYSRNLEAVGDWRKTKQAAFNTDGAILNL